MLFLLAESRADYLLQYLWYKNCEGRIQSTSIAYQ